MDRSLQDSIPQISGDVENDMVYNSGNNDPVTCVLVTNTSAGQVHQLIQLPSESILVVNEQSQEDLVYNPQVQEVGEENTEEMIENNDGKFELLHTEPIENSDHSSAYYSKVFCRECSKLFQNPAQLRDHNITKHSDLFVCGVCLKGFNTATILRQHMLTHSEKQFICTICTRSFTRAATLNNHVSKRHGPKNSCEKCQNVKEPNHMCFKCPHCSASFKNKVNYEEHRCEKTKVFLCPYCGESFTRHAGLINHMLNQENGRKFECVVCKKRFNTQAQLRRHERGHVPETWYTCDICNKKYATASGFRLHNINKHKVHIANALPPKSRLNKKKLQGKIPHTRYKECSIQVSCKYRSKSCQTSSPRHPDHLPSHSGHSPDLALPPMQVRLRDSPLSACSPASATSASPISERHESEQTQMSPISQTQMSGISGTSEMSPLNKETQCLSSSEDSMMVLLKCTEDVIISNTNFEMEHSE